MVAAGIGNAAPQTARAVDQKAVGLFLRTAAQSCQQLSRGAEPVGFFQTEPSSVEDLGVPLRPGSSDAQHRDQVGNGSAVHRDSPESASGDGEGISIPGEYSAHIPEDIVVKAAYEVAEDFNAIGSCIRKEYTYRIYNSRIKNPFYVDRAYFYPKRLDEQVMDRAARAFEGTHDFAAVRSVGTNVRSTVRTIYYCHVTRNGELLELKVCANGFLYNMVRAITGTVLYAAEGKLKPEDIPVILDSGNRTLAGPTAPPGGLYLTRVWYEDERLNG